MDAHRIEIEQSVIAALIALPSYRLPWWLRRLDWRDFSEPVHRELIEAIRECWQDGDRLNVPHVLDRLGYEPSLADYLRALIVVGFRDGLAEELPGLLLDLNGVAEAAA